MSPTTPLDENLGGGPGDLEQQLWDRLAGKPGVEGDSRSLAYADMVRARMVKEQEEAVEYQSTLADAHERARERDLASARQRGLLKGVAPGRARSSWWAGLVEAVLGHEASPRNRRIALGGIAAAFFVGVVVTFQLTRRVDEYDGPQLRGDVQIQKLTDPDPPKRAETIAAGLRQAGIEARIYPGKQATWLEIEVLPENFEAMKPELERAGIVARPGQVLVRISKL